MDHDRVRSVLCRSSDWVINVIIQRRDIGRLNTLLGDSLSRLMVEAEVAQLNLERCQQVDRASIGVPVLLSRRSITGSGRLDPTCKQEGSWP